MSGVILLIGALAIGGRGLNLGIDFTSGSRITASLDRPATQNQIAAIVTKIGAADTQVQKVSDKALGPTVFQISSKKLDQSGVSNLRAQLTTRYGVRSYDSTYVGPTDS